MTTDTTLPSYPSADDDRSQQIIPPLVRSGPTRRGVHPDAHLNYAWRTLQRVKYERYAAGAPVTVRHLDGSTSLVERHKMLRTRALETTLDVYVVCRAFTTCDCCDRGAQCAFVHLVFVGPRARLYQKASAYRRNAKAKQEQRALLSNKQSRSAAARTAAVPSPPLCSSNEMTNCQRGTAALSRRGFYRNPYSLTDNLVFVLIPIGDA